MDWYNTERMIDTDVKSEKGWYNLVSNPDMIDMIMEVYEEACHELQKERKGSLYDDVKYADYTEYFRNGNRINYEKKYFNRRKKLDMYFLLYKICITLDEKKYKTTNESENKENKCKSAEKCKNDISNSDFIYMINNIYKNKEIYKTQLEDILWQICDEYTWALPAHINMHESIDKQIKTLDLFASETGFALSEVLYILGKDNGYIDRNVSERVQYEVRRRIIEPFLYERTDNWWEHTSINWAAVCASAIGHVLIYEGTEKENEIAMNRIQLCMKNYINGFKDDGGCLEGYGYWNYGFGFFVMYMETYSCYVAKSFNIKYKDASNVNIQHMNSINTDNISRNGMNNTIDINDKEQFYNEKIHEIAGFYEKIKLNGKNMVTFSDVPTDTYSYELGMISDICDRYSDYNMPDISYRTHFGDDDCYRFGMFIRNFIWGAQYMSVYSRRLLYNNTDINNADINNTDKTVSNLNRQSIYREKNASRDINIHYLRDCEWYVKRTESYSIAVKAGNNDEPHNHNDIASFIITDVDSYIFYDCGAGEYTKESFNEDTRYNIFVNSSLSHSVPVIAGLPQENGSSYIGKMECVNNEVSVDFTKAYSCDGIKMLLRRIECLDNIVEITDEYCFDMETEIRDRMITEIRPLINSNGIYIKDVLLKYDKAEVETVIDKVVYNGHDGSKKEVYTIDFVPVKKMRYYKLKYVIYFSGKMY